MEPMRNNDTNAASGKSGPNLMLIIGALLVAAVVIFVLRNDNPAEIDFLVNTWTTTVRWSLFIALLLGIALDRVFSIWWRRRGKRKNADD